MTKGETKIAQILTKAGIKFENEKSFADLKHGLFRFDFYIPNLHGARAVVEFQGEQHYYPNSKFFKTRKEFLHQQNNDRRKLSYCLAQNIKAYCIPYWELDNINTAIDLFQEKYLAKTKWKNDDDWRNFQSNNL